MSQQLADARPNQAIMNVWKIAPAPNAARWDECCKAKCITINWLNKKDFSTCHNEDDVKKVLRKAKENTLGSSSIWPFVGPIQQGDVIVANKGTSRVVGVGIVKSDYLSPDDPKNPNKHNKIHRHTRLVDWRIKKEVNLHENIFGIRVPPTVLLLTPEQFLKIKRAYLRDYPELKVDLDELLPGRVQSTVAEDVTATLKRKDIKSTTKQALIAARVGQGKFREQVLQMWGQCCAVTRSVTCDVIRASHIIPWSESTDEQRLDPNNGIPLIASLDALFDVGLISFDKSGRLIVSSKLSAEERQLFGLTKKSLTKTPTPEMEVFLAHHRTQHGFEG